MTAGSSVRSRPPVAGLVLLLAVGGGIYWSIALHSDRPRRFAEVEKGQLYRGGYPEPNELQWAASQFGLRSVVSLMHDEKRSPVERKTAAALGLKYEEVALPGDGCGDYAALDAAATAIARQRKNGPLYFHCAAGKQRSNAALAAYRMKECGWSPEQALRELDRFGLDRKTESKLCDRLERYGREHLADRATAPATSAAERR